LADEVVARDEGGEFEFHFYALFHA
jgi:hypothetical protein